MSNTSQRWWNDLCHLVYHACMSFCLYSIANVNSTFQVFNEENIPQIESIQLFTTTRYQDCNSDIADGLQSWFELVILESAAASEPRLTPDHKPITFYSHPLPSASGVCGEKQEGRILERGHEFLGYLEVLRPAAIFFFEDSC